MVHVGHVHSPGNRGVDSCHMHLSVSSRTRTDACPLQKRAGLFLSKGGCTSVTKEGGAVFK